MSEESLTDTLPEVSTDTLHSIDVGTLFDALPNAPTEQLTSEDPPEPPADLTDPIVRYTTPSGAQYVAVRTEAGGWVVVMATPEPLDKLMIKTNKVLTDLETTVEILDEQPPEVTVGLPAEQIVMKYINISFENATPEDIDLGHLGFHVTIEWLEQNSVHKWSVALNRYDPELKQWISLPTKRIGEDDTYVYYTVVITRFSTFAISGSRVVPPLEFAATSLVINPLEAGTGEPITITADITNLSNTAGTYAVTLWIDDTVEAGKDVSLEAGETTPVSFTVIQDVVGSYEVRLDRLFGSFSVTEVIKAPAAFAASDLSITPDVVGIGEEVTISVLITNTGDLSGSYEATLKIDNVVVATKKVTLVGGASQKVTFTTDKDVAGTYAVTVDGLSGTFEVKAAPLLPPPPPKPINWWLIGGIIAGVIIIGVVVWQVIARRRT